MKRKGLLLVPLLALLVAGAAAGGWVLRGRRAGAVAPTAAPAQAPVVAPVSGPPVEAKIGDIITNLADGHYVQTQLTVELNGPEALKRFQASNAAVQDAVIGTLRSRTSEQLAGETGMRRLADDLRRVLDRALGGDDVKQVYFLNFVVQ